MVLEDFKLVRLSDSHTIKPFDCADSDLNDFVLNDAKPHLSELLAVTYLLENDNTTIAFFSILNDKISHADVESNNQWKKKIRDIMPVGKRYKSYPAIKIGRLGVNKSHQGCQLGSQILDYIKLLFITNNRTGCAYITVDAYDRSLSFYEKNDFKYLTDSDKNNPTRQMYYELRPLYNALSAEK